MVILERFKKLEDYFLQGTLGIYNGKVKAEIGVATGQQSNMPLVPYKGGLRFHPSVKPYP